MNKIEWNETFSVENERIDEQHKMLISMINDLIEMSNNGESPETMAYTVVRMVNYSNLHLETEEELLRSINYPEYDEHLKLHNDYRLTVENICKAENFGITPVPDTILEYLNSWWINHILVEDKRYADFIKSTEK